MHKAKDVIGLPVLSLESGQELGVVQDVLFDKAWNLSGLFIELKTLLFRKERFVPFHAIHELGEDCVMIAAEHFLQVIQQYPGAGTTSLVGKPVYTNTGECLGMVEDVYFQQGELFGYEITDGFLSDILMGRKVFRHDHQSIIGEDVVVVSTDPSNGQTLIEGEEWT